MPNFREVEHMPDFEASPVRRPHSYEVADVAAMSAATPMPKPAGGYVKPPRDNARRGPMPGDEATPMPKPQPTAAVPMPKPIGRRTPVRNVVTTRPGLDRNRPRYGKY